MSNYSITPARGGHVVKFHGVAAASHFVAGTKERAERSARAHVAAHAYAAASKPESALVRAHRARHQAFREQTAGAEAAAETARSDQKLELDRKMGLAPAAAMQSTPYRLVLGGSAPVPPSQRPTTPPAAPAAPRPMPLAASGDPRLASMMNYLPQDDSAPSVHVESTPTRLTLSPVRRK